MSRTGLYLPITGFIAFTVIACNYIDYRKIWYYLNLADLTIITIVIILTSTQILTSTLRYNCFLKACGADIKIKDCMHAVLTALSINSFVPGKAGDITKAIVLTKDKREIVKYTGITIIEKLCDLIVLSIITLIGAFLAENNFLQSVSLGCFFLLVSSFLLLRFADKFPILGSKLRVLPELVITIFRNQKFFLRGIFFCVLLWAVNLTIIFLLLMSVDAGVSASQIISYWPSSMLTGMLPVTISGFGTRDTAFIYALGESLNNTKLLSATFLYTVIVYWFLTALSFIILTFSKTFNLRNS